ncbi:MAG: hypothetical protein EB078_12445 [Proteobacteria bacterium]|nr:hypothetical protein [Pseudomonadota bacterium]
MSHAQNHTSSAARLQNYLYPNQSESKLALTSLHGSHATSLTFLLEITPSLSLTASHKSSRRQSSHRRLMASHKFSGDPGRFKTSHV